MYVNPDELYFMSSEDMQKRPAPKAMLDLVREQLKPYGLEFTDSELWALLDEGGYVNHTASDWFDSGYSFDESYNQALAELAELSNQELPVVPNHADLYAAAKATVESENKQILDRYAAQETRLQELLDEATANYTTDLQDVRNTYGNMRSDILSRQSQQNSQLMDTLQSQMSKQQRNALEAGASAGLRIAGNINTLLSVQNKQSQQSLETSNQLAQMLLNQRAAERGIRNDYNSYMRQNAADRAAIDSNRSDLELSTSSRVNSEYDSSYRRAQTAYNDNLDDFYRTYGDNLFAESYFNKHGYKSKYDTGGNTDA